MKVSTNPQVLPPAFCKVLGGPCEQKAEESSGEEQ